MQHPTCLLAALVLAGLPRLAAGDWPHFMGPTLDRKSPGNAAWQGAAPRKIWTIPTGGGFSSFVTGGGRAYTVVLAEGRETAIAVDRTTGRELWRRAFGTATYRQGGDQGTPENTGGDGPRATPVFAGDRLFVFGGGFDLHALDPATGNVLWSHDLIRDFGGAELIWSNAASPLVLGDHVLVAGGGAGRAFLAFRVSDGKVVWQRGDDLPTHASPVPATLHGQSQVLFFTQRGVVGIDPADGRELWHYPFPYRTAAAASPVVWQDIVNCSAAYGVGGAGFRVKRQGGTWDVEELWRSPGDRDTAAHWSTAVVHEGYLYGCYGRGRESHGSGPLKCIDIRTGQIKWAQPGFGPSQVILVGNRLVATTDAGRLVLIDPTPDAYREVAAVQAIDGKVWSTAAYSDGHLFLRSTKQGVCLKL